MNRDASAVDHTSVVYTVAMLLCNATIPLVADLWHLVYLAKTLYTRLYIRPLV